jgi:methylmalonyl-CoA epimerase
MPHLEHVGIAVKEATAVEELLYDLLGLRSYRSEEVSAQNVRATFVSAGTTKLELLESTAPGSTLAKYLDRHGEGLHHLAFEVEDIFETFHRMQELGLDPVDESPRRGADGRQVFFLHPRQTCGILIELCQDTSPPLEPEFVTYRGDSLATYRSGRRNHPPIVILHGALGATELETRGLFEELAKDHFVVAIDFPGHGASDDIGDLSLDLEGLTNVVTTVMDAEDLERASIFGFSFGGNVALTMARKLPLRVQRLVCHGANPFWRTSQTPELFDPKIIEEKHPAWAQRLDLVHGTQQWKRTAARFLRAVEGSTGTLLTEELIRAVERPVLVTAGDRDSLTPLTDSMRLFELLPDSQLAVLPDTAHPFQHVDATTYAHYIRTFTGHER